MNTSVQPSAAPGASIFNRIPWTLAIIVYLLVVESQGINMQGIPGYIFLGLCVVVLFLEFFKSGDIDTTVFLVDLTTSVLGVILATALICYEIMGMQRIPDFYQWFGCAILLGDAILSPYNAFRTALRNFGVGS